ncbi:hypothetical protein Cgig2_016414 [Carnegiea gigantea]|uniref:Uncharacterized protein n=1 Tax=Carnegiea gigantea TaxID=171969 RepID=A0A9Q1JQD1_9CARY|nr:hypothetical protein Cgig2_016414 [Carnegiea gigantea]
MAMARKRKVQGIRQGIRQYYLIWYKQIYRKLNVAPKDMALYLLGLEAKLRKRENKQGWVGSYSHQIGGCVFKRRMLSICYDTSLIIIQFSFPFSRKQTHSKALSHFDSKHPGLPMKEWRLSRRPGSSTPHFILTWSSCRFLRQMALENTLWERIEGIQCKLARRPQSYFVKTGIKAQV